MRGIEEAWNPEAARRHLERWRELCRNQGWGDIPGDLSTLARVFGASWYFTRFIFFRGRAIASLFDTPPDLSPPALRARVGEAENIEALRIAKNEAMLQVFLEDLRGRLDQAGVERALTFIAEATLHALARLLGMGESVAILGMGRMAGFEMNYGSDLDLIFLLSDARREQDTTSRVKRLLRLLSTPAPEGDLYEIDLRLRPHGTAGPLVTSLSAFIAYHREERATWERQVMTRCRAVVDPRGEAARALEALAPYIYQPYDVEALRQDIAAMRARVERELGRPRGKYDLKKGPGGLMDIDFLTHFLQLAHGHARPRLRTPSVRQALAAALEEGLLGEEQALELRRAYDFLKRTEGRLRVHDMKPLRTFSQDPRELTVLARAMGFPSGEAFLETFLTTTQRIRQIFKEVLDGDGEASSRT